MQVSQPDIHRLLRERFGHASFRPGQERAIGALLAGRDVLAVFPTGAGKSLVYQLTAQLLPAATIVVSPLIALMKDQVETLAQFGLDVSLINSTISDSAASEALERVRSDRAKLLYVTPERFDDVEFMSEIARIRVSLFVVDEAHCVSEWGHSFRPSYLLLAGAIARLGRPPVLALTATATPWIRREIIDRLDLRAPDVVVQGVDRPNLFFEVRRIEAEDEDRRVLRELLSAEGEQYPAELTPSLSDAMSGSGIIYAATTKAVRETAAWLREWGVAADFYHGQRTKADRARVQEAFMSGDLRVIAATNAFGLGVDKPDVRFVIHRDIPASVEAYYQEAGRAGRDGQVARCTLIYRPADLGRAAFLAAGGQLTREELERVHAALLASPKTSLRRLAEASQLSKGDLARAVALLAREGLIEERSGRIKLLVPDFDPGQISLEVEEHRQAYERSRTEMMRGYAETTSCRRGYMLSYFGDQEAERCDMCDNDVPRAAEQRIAVSQPAAKQAAAGAFAIGARVSHTVWGAGMVQRVTDDSLTVLFDTVGYKTLALATVEERGLLKACG